MKLARHRRTDTGQFHSYEVSKIVKHLERIKWWLPGPGRRGSGELLFKGHDLPVAQMTKYWSSAVILCL